ncbi:STAS domain-containing protein [Streptomyces sp. NPDC047014]|uniref:STAS domain-containing protein n=1 Tax=Streptomyces sp. NPDC047014 TaxID=3155736 RepID=UPI0033D84DA8
MTTALIDLRTVARDDRDVRIALAGELDLFTSGQVQSRLRELADSDCRNLVLDLGGLSFCDSAGIELLVRFDRRCRRAGTRLLLCDVPPLVTKSMRVLGADRDLKFVVS